MKILISGSRDWINADVIRYELKKYLNFNVTIIQGGCPTGADMIARKLAIEMGFGCITLNADWNTYGKAAGPKRNQEMLLLEPEVILCFRKGGENSKGTTNMIQLSEKYIEDHPECEMVVVDI